MNKLNSEGLQPCHMCMSAANTEGLTEDNDLSYFSIGDTLKDYRILIGSGDGKAPRILFEQKGSKGMDLVGIYYPKYCPNCGRKITEYQDK